MTVLLFFGCEGNDDTITPTEAQLLNVTNEVVLFEFTPDTGNNTSRLRYEIKFSNPNDTAINGFHRITTDVDGLVSTALSSNFSPCYLIEANSDCTIFFDAEESFNIGRVNSIQLLSVEYNIAN